MAFLLKPSSRVFLYPPGPSRKCPSAFLTSMTFLIPYQKTIFPILNYLTVANVFFQQKGTLYLSEIPFL